jgi:hypothetical protein
MTATDWLLIFGNSALSAMLLRASAEKLIKSKVATAALDELFPRVRFNLTGLVRLTAVLEAIAAIALAAPALRLPAQFLVGALGLAFLVLGILGKARGSSQPCGCLGASSTRPLGTTNVLMGLTLLAVVLLNIEIARPVNASAVAVSTSFLTVVISVVWLFWTSHERIWSVIGNLRKETEPQS